MEVQFDVKKTYATLYRPKAQPSLVTVPPQAYWIVDGEGEPGKEAYTQSVEILYAMSYTLKMGFKQESWYKPFVVAPLEGVWSSDERENRSLWKWSSMISQPGFVTNEIFTQVQQLCRFKKQLPTELARFAIIEEGLCVTMMHLGPYAEEPRSFDAMEAFCKANQVVRKNDEHREIYLCDPSKTASEKLKTVIRFAVSRI
jgi:hypothetical protein